MGKLTPTVTTTIHNASEAPVTSVPAGSTVHDRADVSGTGPAVTGNVDFTFYTSANCTTGGSASGTGIALVSGVAHPSTSQGPLNAGSYSFKATYNGDTNYNAASSTCEPLTVTVVVTPSPPPTVTPIGPTPTGPVGGLVEIVVPGTGGAESGTGAALLGLIFVAIVALFSAGSTAVWVARRR